MEKVINRASVNLILRGELRLRYFPKGVALANFFNLSIGKFEDCTVDSPRQIAKIFKSIVESDSVDMIPLHSFRARTEESIANNSMHLNRASDVTLKKSNFRIVLSLGLKNATSYSALRALLATYTAKVRNAVLNFISDYGFPDFVHS